MFGVKKIWHKYYAKNPLALTVSGQQQAACAVARGWTLYNKLWNFVMSEIQRKVFAGSFDWKSILDVDTLLSQAAVTVEAFLIQFMATSEGVALSSVLTQTCNA